MCRIFTHTNMDLDACASAWAAKRFVVGMERATIEFRPANWDGAEMTKNDVAVDMKAGGRGVKGVRDPDGTVHSAFVSILMKHASDVERGALEHLVTYVDAQDAHGNAVKYLVPGISCEVANILSFNGINAVLRALQAKHHDDHEVLYRMSEIFDGMLKTGLARYRAMQEAEEAEILPGGKVAIVTNSREYGTNGVLFEQKGVRVVVYIDGQNLGLIRHNDEKLRMDDPEFRKVVEAAGETISEGGWFAHDAGYLFCRGSRKAPAKGPSAVKARDLAELAARLLG